MPREAKAGPRQVKSPLARFVEETLGTITVARNLRVKVYLVATARVHQIECTSEGGRGMSSAFDSPEAAHSLERVRDCIRVRPKLR